MQITNAIELVIKAKAETESSAFLTPWGIRDLERRCRNAEKLLDECRSIMAANGLYPITQKRVSAHLAAAAGVGRVRPAGGNRRASAGGEPNG